MYKGIGWKDRSYLYLHSKHHVAKETSSNNIPTLKNIFWDTTWKNKNLGSVTQAGLINNLNDGMVWGIFPILLAQKHFSLEQIGIVTATYPAIWGIGQLFTGKMADKFCKKDISSKLHTKFEIKYFKTDIPYICLS